ncbi:MAG: LacI family DNA-binding transcriptional regulator [Opitutus sp.]
MTAHTLKDVARVAGMSVSGVSYALRGHASIPAATVERVRRIAADVGYRPDLRVASVMAHIRRQRLPRDRETLAFVWVSTPPGEKFPAYHQRYLRTILAGAKARAEQLGCTLTEFWLDEPGMTPRRLAQILRARGITGVVFSPAMLHLTVKIEWEWQHFACAIIGNTEWQPVLHRAGHYHYRSMWLTLQRLREEGWVRPAAILNRSIHERIHGVHLAAFQVNHPSPGRASQLAQFALPGDYEGLKRWSRALAPDALIIGWPANRVVARDLSKFAPTAKRVVTLDWQPGGIPGMDVNNETIAASAVDLVIAQLHRNERGLPANPTTLLLDGTWRESP